MCSIKCVLMLATFLSGVLLSGCTSRPKNINQAIMELKGKNAIAKERAARDLGELALNSGQPEDRKKAVAALAEALNDPDEEVRSMAAMSLGQIGLPSKGSLPSLARCLHDQNDTVRTNAACAIMLIAEKDTERTIPDSEDIVQELLAVLHDKDQFVRAHSVRALAALAPEDGEVIQRVAAMLNDKDVSVRISSVEALGSLGPKAKQYAPSIKRLLDDDSDTVRHAASTALRAIEGNN